MTRSAALFLAATLLAGTASAAPPPCATPENDQFDFWIGDWVVTRADDGRYAGQSHVESVLGGCALHESWIGAKGYTGYSYNAYDANRGVWHQTWVDSSGGLLIIEGRFDEGRMVLQGDARQADGKPITNRIAWTPLADGRVRQTWDATVDGGRSWQTVFDGIYAKRAAGGAAPGAQANRRDI